MVMFQASSLKIQDKGYTLIEVLTVTTIIALIAGAFFFSFSRGREEKALQMSAHRLIQDLRVIQDRALAPLAPEKKEELCGQQQPSEHELEKVIFGAYFETNSEKYILFVDCSSPENYNYDEGIDKKVTPIGLERGIKISGLSTDGVLSVVFSPPDPKLYINGDPASDDTEITISLKNKPDKKKIIKIHRSGLIEILN